jgi:hypothetical protein
MSPKMWGVVSTPQGRGRGSRNTFCAASTRELLSLGIEEATLLLRDREGEGDSARGTNVS